MISHEIFRDTRLRKLESHTLPAELWVHCADSDFLSKYKPQWHACDYEKTRHIIQSLKAIHWIDRLIFKSGNEDGLKLNGN